MTAGQSTIAGSGARMTVTQATPRAAINWNSYSIGADASVTYVQPNAQAISLNRVVGNDPSQIFGRLTANGQVWLSNPNGILFGRTARVDVAGLVASTANITNEDFMAGGSLNRFSEPGRPDAAVVNEGEITIREAGLAALVAPGVRNSGTINARLGRVSLGSGSTFTLDLYGDQLVNLELPAAQNAVAADGSAVQAGVTNSGRIMADGGRIQLSANLARGVVDNVIRMPGELVARSASLAENGDIILDGGEAGTVDVGGTIDVSGRAAKQQGGRVRITGARVRLAPTVTIDASGDNAGGTVETSASALAIAAGAAVRVGARAGRPGAWLIDPSDITIDAAMAAAIEATLEAGGNVTVTTAAGSGGNGDLVLAADLDAGAGSEPTTLTLTARRMTGYVYPTLHRISTLGDLVLNPNAVNYEAAPPPEPPGSPIRFYVHRLGNALGLIGTVAGTAIMNVPPGIYVERLSVTRPVILRGAMAGQDPTGLFGGASVSMIDPRTQSVIVADPYRSAGQLQVTSSNVTIDGFTITGTLLGNVAEGAGILVSPATRPLPGQDQIRNVTIVNNFITGNGRGIGFRSYLEAGVTSPATLFENVVVDRNRIQINNHSYILDPVDGRVVSLTRVAGNGIYFFGDTNNTLITRNLIVDNNSDGIIYSAGFPPLPRLAHRSATILGNVIENAGYSGITVAGDLSAVTIAGNVVRDAFHCAGASSTCAYTQPGLVVPYSYPPTQIAGHGAITIEDAAVDRGALGAPSIRVADNDVSGGPGNGITLMNLSAACAPACSGANSPRVDVVRNAIHDLAGDTSGHGIRLFGDTVATIVADNTVDVGSWAVVVDGPLSGFASAGISVVRNALAGDSGGALVSELTSGSVSIMGNSTIGGGRIGVRVNPMLGGFVSIGGNDTIQGTNSGIAIAGVAGAVVHVFGNGTVSGGDAGLRVDSVDRSFVTINGNGTIGGGQWGILVSLVEASRVIMSGNGSVAGTSQGGVTLSGIAGSVVVLDGAAAVTNPSGPGVHVEGVTRSAIHLLGIDAITGGTAGVMIDGADTSLVSVNRNGTFTGGTDGIAIVDPRAATVVVEGNHEIAGSTLAGIRVDGAAASLIVIDQNDTITGASTGVLARGTTDSLLAINANGTIAGRADSGVQVEDTTNSLVTVDGNGTISGGRRGLGMSHVSGSDVVVFGNGSILGTGGIEGSVDAGVALADIADSQVVLSANNSISGLMLQGGDGLRIARAERSAIHVLGGGTLSGLVGVTIDQVADSLVSINGNRSVGARFDAIAISNLHGVTLVVEGNANFGTQRTNAISVLGASQSQITIKGNDTLQGVFGAGVWIGASVDVAADVSGNRLIAGGLGGGIVIVGAASSSFLVTGNALVDGSSAVSFTDLSASRAVVAGNTIFGDTGIAFVSTVSGLVQVLDNSVTPRVDGLVLDGRGAAPGVTAVTIAGNTIAFAQRGTGGTGIAVLSDSPGSPPGVPNAGLAAFFDVTFGAGNRVTGTGSAFASPFLTPPDPGFEVGLLLDGANSAITGNALGDMAFAAIAGNYITLANHALYSPGAPTLIDATGVSFDGVAVGDVPPSPSRDALITAIEGRITDFDDRSGGDPLNNPSFVGQIVFLPEGALTAAGGNHVPASAHFFVDPSAVNQPIVAQDSRRAAP